jgi:uncharacterized protein
MLLEFTVENYRSIKEPVTLSAVAQKSRKVKAGKRAMKSDAEICPGFPVEGWDMELLPVMAIFGANASGKSNVVSALDYFALLVTGNHTKAISIQSYKSTTPNPFKLDSTYHTKPTKFCIQVAVSSYIYKYRLEIIQSRVIFESLVYSTSETKRPRILFERKWSEQQEHYLWKNGESFQGSHLQLQKSIRETELFMVVLERLKIAKIQLFSKWIGELVVDIIQPSLSLNTSMTNTLISYLDRENPSLRKKVVGILRNFDTGLVDLEIRRSPDSSDVEIFAVHEISQGNRVVWRFEEESLGTQKLLSFSYLVISVLEDGGLMSVDELGTNLHPQITSYIIQLFQNPKTNPKGAQLIFTSHDNTLQRNQLLRRDEIWFTEKKPDQSTDLYSLADFKVRNDLAIDKAYLDGRFGAVPFLPDTVEELLGVE